MLPKTGRYEIVLNPYEDVTVNWCVMSVA